MHSEVVGVGIWGMGKAVPDRVLTNEELEKVVDTSDEWIRTRTGISERRIVDEDTATSHLATRAARGALQQAQVRPCDLDMIIVATVTSDMLFPATACLLQDRLGADDAAAFDLGAGCSGFVYGLAAAEGFIKSGSASRVLVVGSEVLSKITDWEDRSTCVLFGDGAAAAVVGPCRPPAGILATYLGADGSGGGVLNMPAGGSLRPASEETLQKRLHYIHMKGREVFKFAVRAMGDSAVEVARRAGIQLQDVDCYIPHQANIRIIESSANRLGIPMEKVYVNIDRYGNTSSASVPIALTEAQREGMVRPGDNVLMVAFGAGLTWAAAIVRWMKESDRIE